jgi:hypothetical protein
MDRASVLFQAEEEEEKATFRGDTFKEPVKRRIQWLRAGEHMVSWTKLLWAWQRLFALRTGSQRKGTIHHTCEAFPTLITT